MCCCNQILDASSKVTPCECPAAGWCARHGLDKPAHFHSLCRSDIAYFDAYERGRGPGQIIAGRVIGLGDAAAFLIRVVTFGRVQPCNACNSRRAWLNSKVQLWPVRWPWGKR